MKYNMLPETAVKRICDAFYAHSMCVNERYAQFNKSTPYWYSDRDRFVGRLSKQFVGKMIAFMDKEVFAYAYDGCPIAIDPHSVFSTKEVQMWNRGKPLTRAVKRYYFIQRFNAVNEINGSGYISMECLDVFGNTVVIRIDEANLKAFQFAEITSAEFGSVAKLFEDDRDSMPFQVTRYLDYEEILKRTGKKRFEKMMHETITIVARDSDEAAAATTNVVSVVLGPASV